MKKFKAFRIHDSAGKVKAGFELISLDELSAGNVVIKSVYSGINYKDALAATGAGHILQSYPLVAGIDVAGYVEASADQRFKVGDEVLVCGAGLSESRDGGYAEFVRVPGDIVLLLPAGLTLFQAMALGTAGFTSALAVRQLQLNGQIPSRGPIAVTGATGGVGSFAIDILSGLGFEVTAVTSKHEKMAYLETLGATKILLRDNLNLSNKPLLKAQWGGAVDCVGGELLSWLTRTVKPLGNIAVIGLAGRIELTTTVMPFILRGINLLGITSVFCPMELKKLIWQQLATELKPAHIQHIVTAEIAFEQLPEMFTAYLHGEITGRTVVKITS